MLDGYKTADGDRKGSRVIIVVLLIFYGIISLFIGAKDYRFRGEEPTRLVMSYEMFYQGKWAQPTYLGENYYRKPPLINWLIEGSSYLWGWSKFTGRFVSIFSTILVLILLYSFSFIYIYKSYLFALLSSLVFLSFIDVLFWYGFLIEIDMTLTFFVLLQILALYLSFRERSYVFFAISGFSMSLAFLLKGFPSYVFFGATSISLLLYYFIVNRKIDVFFLKGILFSLIISFIPIFIWIYNLPNPEIYLHTLWSESFGRVEKSKDIFKFITHLISYPILNIKQTLLMSGVVIILLLKNFRNIRTFLIPDKPILPLVLIFFINYIPYWISAGARGRYILPLLPLVAIYIVDILRRNLSLKKGFKLIVFIAFFTFSIRILLGLFYFPYETSKKGFYYKVSSSIFYKLDKRYYNYIVSDCEKHKGLIFYLDIWTHSLITTEKLKPDWKYFISCKKRLKEDILGEFYIKDEKIILYQRVK